MKNRVPDLERCKWLLAAGYEGATYFVWALNEMKEWKIISSEKAVGEEYLKCAYYKIIPAPLVTELVEDLPKTLPQENVIDSPLLIYPAEDKWCAGYAFRKELHKADTLPNALADLWMELKGEKK